MSQAHFKNSKLIVPLWCTGPSSGGKHTKFLRVGKWGAVLSQGGKRRVNRWLKSVQRESSPPTGKETEKIVGKTAVNHKMKGNDGKLVARHTSGTQGQLVSNRRNGVQKHRQVEGKQKERQYRVTNSHKKPGQN